MQSIARFDTVAIRDRNEALPRPELQALQLERLQQTVARVLAAQPVGASRLREAGITDAREVHTLEVIREIPFTAKQDLRDNYPFGLFAVPREEVVRLHASSGTHGKATIVGYTRSDLENWIELVARCMTMGGVRQGMLVHNANGYGLFTGGFGFHQGAERLGATIVPAGAGFTARQATLIAELGADVLVSTPSYAIAIAASMRAAGIDPEALNLRIGLFGGEPATRAMLNQIDRELGIASITNYGLSEMCGPGVASECAHARNGLHVHEDHFLTEVIDPDTGEVLAPGQEGELVFTTLTKEALPLIRYRTGDMGRVAVEPCSCGRTTARLMHLSGRRDDMVTVRGINVFPSTVEHLLLSIGGLTPVYRLVVERPGALDELTVECEYAGAGNPEMMTMHVESVLRESMGMRVRVVMHEPGMLPFSEGKAVRVIDRRP
jgi:phenylacetate-CoA ligase